VPDSPRDDARQSRRLSSAGPAVGTAVAWINRGEAAELPMDLNTITEIHRPGNRDDFLPWRAGDAWLAGGTWLFSEPQPELNRLIDLAGLAWSSLEIASDGLRIGATCTLAQLAAVDLPASWLVAPLFRQCCRALLGSFKIWNAATVGGNLCMALPAGPMAALTVALDGVCEIWTPDGTARRLPAAEFVLGPQRNALRPGEVLRAVWLPVEASRRRTAFRQISLTPLGRSAALLIGTLAPSGAFAVTVTAATRRPVRLGFQAIPGDGELRHALDRAIPDALYYDDLHGAPDWRRHMTFRFAEQIRRELSETDPA
jgi:CO/xanthine dehydrogenase FAD-binding subunit